MLGISISDYDNMTPKQLRLRIRAYSDEYQIKIKNEQRLLTIQAYQLSRWVWEKKLDINKILDIDKPKQTMTDEQMLTQIKALNAMFGGVVNKDGSE